MFDVNRHNTLARVRDWNRNAAKVSQSPRDVARYERNASALDNLVMGK